MNVEATATAPAPALRALFERVIDYAGLFPPAELSLEDAVRTYLEHRAGPYAWMLGRFVCPANRLAELGDLLQALRVEASLRLPLALILRSGATAAEMVRRAAEDAAAAQRLRQQVPAVAVEALELRLDPEVVQPDAASGQPASLSRTYDVLREIETILTQFGLGAAAKYCEVAPALVAANGHLEAIRTLAGLHAVRSSSSQEAPSGAVAPMGFKYRMGGTSADAFPSSAALARTILACREAQLPWKATAGLHHPFRHYDPTLGVTMHGFVNVLMAAVLVYRNQLADEAVPSLLDDAAPQAFRFTEQSVRWREHSAAIDDIRKTRVRFFHGFGSCRFDEPVGDLKTADWL